MLIKFFTLLFLLSILSLAYGNGEFYSGGPCEYREYKGLATITSVVSKIDHRKESNDKYLVKFSFTPEAEVKEKFAQPEGKEFVLLLGNSEYPGSKYLQKYGIRVGTIFDCTMKVIVRGTCTPVLFEFRTINLNDYLCN
jgi:hypothetical protein